MLEEEEKQRFNAFEIVFGAKDVVWWKKRRSGGGRLGGSKGECGVVVEGCGVVDVEEGGVGSILTLVILWEFGGGGGVRVGRMQSQGRVCAMSKTNGMVR